MIRLLTGAPRETGEGEYAGAIGRAFPGAVEVFYGRPLSPSGYDGTRPVDGWWPEGRMYLDARWRLGSEADRTHVVGEGFGPVFGRRTRLVTVHQVCPEPFDDGHTPPLRRSLRQLALRRNLRALARLGTEVAVDSAATGAAFERRFGADPARISTVPNAVDLERFRPGNRAESRARLGLDPNAFVVLHLSQDDGRKNVAGALRVWERLRRQVPRARLVHVGRSRAFGRYRADHPSSPVTSIDRVSPETLPDLYRAADVLFHPSFLEGFGYPVLEAFASGIPAVVSDLPVFREELADQFVGRPPADEAGFVAALGQLARGDVVPDPWALVEHVRQRFSLESFRARLGSVYQSVGLDPSAG